MEPNKQKDYTRQLGFFDPSEHSTSVTVIGAGGIGGPTVLALAKLGVRKIRVFDFDRVEAGNQPNQLYGLSCVGDYKVKALNHHVKELADVVISTAPRRLRPSDHLSGIVIGAVDSMASRKAIWNLVKRDSANVQLYIDGRIGGQVIRVLSAQPRIKRQAQKYEASLTHEHLVAQLKCTERAIIDVSFVVASLIVRAYRLWCTKKERISDLYYDHRNLAFIKA